MIKNKKLKTNLAGIIAFIIYATIYYGLIAFIAIELNPLLWHNILRGFFVFFLIHLFYVTLNSRKNMIKQNEQKNDTIK